jgi:hypothetical protein
LLAAVYRPKEAVSQQQQLTAMFSARYFIQWEQACSVLNYCRDGLNVICAFHTSSFSLLFLASVVGIFVIVLNSGSGQSCTQTVVVIIFALVTGAFLLPILIFAYFASRFDQQAAYALHDLATQSSNIRARRDLGVLEWDSSKLLELNQRQETWNSRSAHGRSTEAFDAVADSLAAHASTRDLLRKQIVPVNIVQIAEAMRNYFTPATPLPPLVPTVQHAQSPREVVFI